MTLNTTYKTKREFHGVAFVRSSTSMIVDDRNDADRIRKAIKVLKESRPDLCGDKTIMKLAAYICRSPKGSLVRNMVIDFCDMLEQTHVCC